MLNQVDVMRDKLRAEFQPPPETPPLLVIVRLNNEAEYGVRAFAERNGIPSLDAAIFVLIQLGFQHEYTQFLESCRPPKIIYQEPAKQRKNKRRKRK